MRVTLKQIAEASGYAIATVGHVLGQYGDRYKPATRQAILKTAKELGYRPNSAARTIRTGRYDCISLILGDAPLLPFLPSHLLSGIQKTLSEKDIHLALWLTDIAQADSPHFASHTLNKSMSDGLLMYYSRCMTHEMVQKAGQWDEPVIWINIKSEFDCVYIDDLEGGKRATQHLLDMGHRRIAYVDLHNDLARPHHYSQADRYLGYEQAMRQAGLAVWKIIPESPAPPEKQSDERLAVLEKQLKSPEGPPTAILAYGSNEATALVQTACRLGLKVPGDLSVLTFFMTPMEGLAGIPISTMLLPNFEMGQQAAALILQKISDPQTKLASLAMTPGPIVGQTCTPPRNI